MLHVYARGAQWWCHAPGVGRRALGLPVASATHAEAYRVAAQRFAAGALDARAAEAARESDLIALRRPGVSVRDVQRLLGHADLETTQRYLGRYRSDADRPAVDMGLAAVLRGEDVATVLPLRRRG